MSAEPGHRWRVPAACAALVAAVLLAFWPALSADFQAGFDDNYNLTENAFYRGFTPEHLRWMLTSFRLGHWQPLSWLSLAADHALWGMDARGYHLTNVLLHALNAVLFFGVCRAVLRAAYASASRLVWPAFAAALLFAVHPLRVESVVWITERRDVLSLFFLLPALLAWLRWREDGRRRWYGLALAAYALSLMSKAWGLTLPAVLLVLDAWPLRRFRWSHLGGLLVEKAPFIALALVAAVLAFLAQRDSGAMHYAEHFSPLQKAAQACYGLPFYARKTLWPSHLSPAYLLDRGLDPFAPPFLLGFAATAAGVAAAWAARRRAPAVTASLLVYAILVAPVLGLTQSGIQLVADRYTYLPTLPFYVLLAGWLGGLRTSERRRAAAAAALAAAAVLGWLTYGYAGVWHDSWILWRYTLERDPQNSFACNQLGVMYREAGNGAQAMELFERAVAADPSSHLAYENRGIMRHNAGDDAGALADWEKAIELNDRCEIPLVNRGSLRFQAGDYEGARRDYEQAVDVNEDAPMAWYMLASARKKLGDTPGARTALGRCLAQTSPDAPLHAQALKFQSQLGP